MRRKENVLEKEADKEEEWIGKETHQSLKQVTSVNNLMTMKPFDHKKSPRKV